MVVRIMVAIQIHFDVKHDIFAHLIQQRSAVLFLQEYPDLGEC